MSRQIDVSTGSKFPPYEHSGSIPFFVILQNKKRVLKQNHTCPGNTSTIDSLGFLCWCLEPWPKEWWQGPEVIPGIPCSLRCASSHPSSRVHARGPLSNFYIHTTVGIWCWDNTCHQRVCIYTYRYTNIKKERLNWKNTYIYKYIYIYIVFIKVKYIYIYM